MQTATTVSTAACRGTAKAADPPAASMTAAASCVGAIERANCREAPDAAGRDNDHSPSAEQTVAAHTQSTPAISMGPQYEAANGT